MAGAFTSVKDLFLSDEVGGRVAPALQELARERVIKVLSTLQNLVLQGFQSSGPMHEAIQQFLAGR
jgi:hypothetical protein